MKIVITGSEGFLGRVICHKLSRKDFQIIKLDKKLNYDLTKPASLSGISDFDVLIHLASLSFVPDSFENPSSFYHTNITLRDQHHGVPMSGTLVKFSFRLGTQYARSWKLLPWLVHRDVFVSAPLSSGWVFRANACSCF